MEHLFVGMFVVVFICLIVLLVIFTLSLKYKVQMSGKTKVNCSLSHPVILKEIPPSNQIFSGINSTHSYLMTSFIT